MMDISRFLQEGAKFMAADRPDIWDRNQAFQALTSMFSYLAGIDEDSGSTSCGGFSLYKFIDDDEIEYSLCRQVLTFSIFDDADTLLTDWTSCSALSNIGLDVPDYEDFIDDDDDDL